MNVRTHSLGVKCWSNSMMVILRQGYDHVEYSVPGYLYLISINVDYFDNMLYNCVINFGSGEFETYEKAKQHKIYLLKKY